MANPIIEQIAQDIVSTLQTVTTANGYQQSVNEVTRERQSDHDDWTAENHDIRVVQGNSQRVEAEATLMNTWLTPFLCMAFVSPQKDNATPLDTLKSRFAADISKALMADPQRSNLALNTEVAAWMQFETDEQAYQGITVVLEVTHRTLETDPYSSS